MTDQQPEPRRIDPNASPEKLRAALEAQTHALDVAAELWGNSVKQLRERDAEIAGLKAVLDVYRRQAMDATGALNEQKRRADVAAQERDQLAAELIKLTSAYERAQVELNRQYAELSKLAAAH